MQLQKGTIKVKNQGKRASIPLRKVANTTVNEEQGAISFIKKLDKQYT